MENIDFFDIEKLRNIFLHTTTSYKFFWMLAILDFAKMKKIEKPIPYDVLTARMIAKAWKPIMQQNLFLGKQDMFLKNILEIILCSPLSKDSLEENIIQQLEKNRKNEWYRKLVKKLTIYVPERLLYPWIGTCTREEAVAMSGKAEKRSLYTLTGNNSIVINRLWREYLETNATFLEGFVYQSLYAYLEKRNRKVKVTPFSLEGKGEKGGYAFNSNASEKNDSTGEYNPFVEEEVVSEKTDSKMENNTYNTYINVLNIRGDCTVLGDLITDNGKKINNVFFKQQ